MKVFNNLEEMNQYYNEETNTYEFIENGNLIDVKIDFGLNIECNINAGDIKAHDIKARNINARDIDAGNIKAHNINANNIRYNSVCCAESKFICNSIKGTRKNSKYFCLDSDVVIKGDKKNVK